MSNGNESGAIAVKDTAVSLECVHNVHCCDGDGFAVLSEGQGVSHDFAQEVIDEVTDMSV